MVERAGEVFRVGSSRARIVRVTLERIEYLDMAGQDQVIDLKECARNCTRSPSCPLDHCTHAVGENRTGAGRGSLRTNVSIQRWTVADPLNAGRTGDPHSYPPSRDADVTPDFGHVTRPELR